jgi:hypothetical protein
MSTYLAESGNAKRSREQMNSAIAQSRLKHVRAAVWTVASIAAVVLSFGYITWFLLR